MNNYEALVIFGPSVKEDSQDAVLVKIEDEVTRLKGRVLSSQVLGKRTFARPLRGQEAGVYARMALGLEPGSVEALQARLKLTEDVFRIQIVRSIESAAEPEDNGGKTAEVEGTEEN